MADLSNNLFCYATSELSQDAFICWLFSHLLIENKDKDLFLSDCARTIVKLMYPAFGETQCIDEIHKQVDNIDVLLKIGEKYIIIEDKTFTDSHDDQINRYKQSLIKKGVPETDIICVYYKVMNQSKPEQDVDFEFTRESLLEVFAKYDSKIDNAIFKDYVEYLRYIDGKVNSYKSLSVGEWSYEAYIGMFVELQNGILKQYHADWGYVSNPTGGFMGMWWDGLHDELRNIGIGEELVGDLYPQIEDNLLAIKISAGTDENRKEETTSLRWKLYDYFQERIGKEFKKKTFRYGKYMTVGYIEYNENDYADKINKVNKLISELPNAFTLETP